MRFTILATLLASAIAFMAPMPTTTPATRARGVMSMLKVSAGEISRGVV